MSEKARKGKGYSAKTIENSHGLLYSVMEYAVKRKWREHNPCGDSDLPVVKLACPVAVETLGR